MFFGKPVIQHGWARDNVTLLRLNCIAIAKSDGITGYYVSTSSVYVEFLCRMLRITSEGKRVGRAFSAITAN
jgi:hypothetical protein